MRKFLCMVSLAAVCVVGCKNKEEGAGGEPVAKVDPKKDPNTDPKKVDPKKADPPASDKDPKVVRGEYIAKLGACQYCHTPFGPKGPDMGKTWAGGLEIPDLIGTWRSPNITQHKETGIGGWTDEQIKAAIREGKRPDGEQLFPIMPYMLYNRLSDDDADALVAYLRTIEGIDNKVERATDLKMGKPTAPKPAGTPAPPTSDKLKHGEYLVTIMHCVMCHTPFDEKAKDFDMKKAYAGGLKFELPMMGEGALYSSNLTPHETGIKDYSDEEMANAIRMMKKKDGSIIMGPMSLYQGSWFDLGDEDVSAISAFLRSLPPIENKVPASTFKPKVPPPPGAPK